MRLVIITIATIFLIGIINTVDLFQPYKNIAVPAVIGSFLLYLLIKIIFWLGRKINLNPDGKIKALLGRAYSGLAGLFGSLVAGCIALAIIAAILHYPGKWAYNWFTGFSDKLIASTESRTVISPFPTGIPTLEKQIVFDETLQSEVTYKVFRVEANHVFRFESLDKPIRWRISGNKTYRTFGPHQAGQKRKSRHSGVLEVVSNTSQNDVKIVRLPYSVWTNRPL